MGAFSEKCHCNECSAKTCPTVHWKEDGVDWCGGMYSHPTDELPDKVCVICSHWMRNRKAERKALRDAAELGDQILKELEDEAYAI